MPEIPDYLEEVGQIVRELEGLGLKLVLVGGMALVTLGSERVTKDFDFVISKPGDRIEGLIKILYKRGLQLASRLVEGEIVSTIDNRKVAEIRLRLDVPSSAYFLNPKTGLRIDLLFDFPISAAELAEDAKTTKVSSHVISVASENDLIRLKKIAKSNRSSPRDTEDLHFLKTRQKESK